jgi:hypothetical protein
LTVEQIGPEPLAYQAVRLKVTLHNQGEKVIGDLVPLELHFQILAESVEAGNPTETIWPGMRLAPTIDLERFDTIHATPLGRLIRLQRLVLQPGEKESVTFAFPVQVAITEAGLPLAGRYSLRVRYYGILDRPADQQLIETIMISVREPKRDDIALYRILVANPKLAAALRSRAEWSTALPEPGTVGLLEKIVLRYPKSSYADYARFALARIYLGGNDKIHSAPADAKAAAAALLEAIDYQQFAYAPTALFWLKSITSDAGKGAKIDQTLEIDFADSIERLAEQANAITQEQWNKMKQQAPIRRGPRRPPLVPA